MSIDNADPKLCSRCGRRVRGGDVTVVISGSEVVAILCPACQQDNPTGRRIVPEDDPEF